MGQYHTVLVLQYGIVKGMKNINPESISGVFGITSLILRSIQYCSTYWHVAKCSIDGPASD